MKTISITTVFRMRAGEDKTNPDRAGTWWVYVRVPRPAKDKQIKVEGATTYALRHLAERDADVYRAAAADLDKTPKGEDCDTFVDRYLAHQKSQGHTDTGKKLTRWNKWISRVMVRGGTVRFGDLPIASVTTADVEDVRDALDAAILAWAPGLAAKHGTVCRGKTAMNAWSALTSTFKEATTSKRKELCVLKGKPNPCIGVQAPGDKRTRKARRKTFLFPREADQLLSCEAVPRDWREVYALALYTYLRPGELRVLLVSDVDLEAGHIHVSKAWDYAEEKIKPPKTANGVRYVPIEPSLHPLLARMIEGKDGSDLVAPRLSAFGEDHLAEQFRRHLRVAKVDRAELHKSTATHVQANFRSCRDSGLTWLAMSGLGVDKIMRRAGHDEVQTTMGYVKQAEDLSGGLGVTFGALPADLTACEPRVICEPTKSLSVGSGTPIQRKFVPEEGVEPPT